MSKSTGYNTYEFTAFTGAELFGDFVPGDGDIVGLIIDPSSATAAPLKFQDQDPFLGRAGRHGEALDGNGQVPLGGGDGQFFSSHQVELEGSDGIIYYMIEIEQEGSSDNYFTFYGDVPPTGVTLEVKAVEDVKGRGVEYDKLGADPTTSISGVYFCDDNNNGLYDEGDPGVSGKEVMLVGLDGAVIDTTSTDDAGNYSFESIPVGEYKIFFASSEDIGKFFIAANVGDEEVDSDVINVVDGYGVSEVVFALTSDEVTGVNAGVAYEEFAPVLQTASETDLFLL